MGSTDGHRNEPITSGESLNSELYNESVSCETGYELTESSPTPASDYYGRSDSPEKPLEPSAQTTERTLRSSTDLTQADIRSIMRNLKDRANVSPEAPSCRSFSLSNEPKSLREATQSKDWTNWN